MDWQRIIYSLPGVLIGFTVHEYFHALVAYKLGDNTARDQGRLSLDPIKHIDPIGMLFIIFAGFGWAKPVQFNPDALRNPKRDKALIAAAGPFSNFILGIIFILIAKGILLIPVENTNTYDALEYIFDILFYCAYTNFGLFVFNILPLPPLDGSHIFLSGLNLSTDTENKIMKFGTPILFIIFIIQSRSDFTILPISKIVNALIELFI
ncbi:zinc metalloprotease [Spirochaetia bacterium]|nr:zinc metalloprotease [Spirochaetia bacterium]